MFWPRTSQRFSEIPIKRPFSSKYLWGYNFIIPKNPFTSHSTAENKRSESIRRSAVLCLPTCPCTMGTIHARVKHDRLNVQNEGPLQWLAVFHHPKMALLFFCIQTMSNSWTVQSLTQSLYKGLKTSSWPQDMQLKTEMLWSQWWLLTEDSSSKVSFLLVALSLVLSLECFISSGGFLSNMMRFLMRV